MRYRAQFWLAAFSLTLAGCVSAPESYPPPEQHLPFRSGGVPATEFLSMDHPDLRKSVVRDVNVDEAGPWKWTGVNPELRYQIPSTENWSLVVEFVIHERTFRETGPVTVSFYVNDHLAGEEQYTSHGDKVFERTVPAAWLTAADETRLRLRVHNVWRSGGSDLGILLKRAGFVQ